MKNQRDELQSTLSSQRSLSPKLKRKKSPSPLPEEPPRRGRRQKSPSPQIISNKKQKSPSSPPKKAKRAKSLSPPPKNTKKINSLSPAAKRSQKLKSPSPPKSKINKKNSVKTDNKRKSAADAIDDVKIKRLDKSKDDNSEDDSNVLASTIYPINCQVEAKMHNTW